MHYVLTVYQPDGPTPSPAELEKIMHDLDVLNQEMKDAGRLGIHRRPAPAEHGHRPARSGRRRS